MVLRKIGPASGRIPRTAPNRGKQTNQYDFSGLVARLKELEPEFRKVEDDVREKRRAAAAEE